jgi:Ran GTPase-activating protein (RanGAP) involved in mRNA processing and transport
MNKLEGRMLNMLNELFEQNTPFEYSVTGLDLGPARCRILAQHIAYNTTLLSIHLSRRKISDVDGVSIAKMLITNKTLRKLELEGNLLGPKSFAEFGTCLKQNNTLKLLDLESNQLTVDGQEMYGVYQFTECFG